MRYLRFHAMNFRKSVRDVWPSSYAAIARQCKASHCWLVGWLVGRLVGWLACWLAGWLVVLVGWCASWFGVLVVQFWFVWIVDLVCWSCLLVGLIGWLDGWLVGWFAVCLVCQLA